MNIFVTLSNKTMNQEENQNNQDALNINNEELNTSNAGDAVISDNQQTQLDSNFDVLAGLRQEQKYLNGTLAALAVGIIGAILWAVITVITNYQIGYMALAIGAGVGFINKIVGKGVDQKFGITGAAIAVLSCILGNVFAMVALLSKELQIGYAEVVTLIGPIEMVSALFREFGFIDVLFLGLAAIEGYKFSFIA